MLNLTTTEILQYLSIPVVAALVGWVTNWMAVKLMFYPLEFIGIRPFFGWQGIVPMKARKMAGISVDTSLATLGSVREIAGEINLQLMAGHAIQVVDPLIESYTEEAMLAESPTLWNNLPQRVKNQIFARIRRELPDIVEELMTDVEEQIESLLDLKRMIQNHLTENKELLVRIFLEVGAKEFRFIINSGIFFGFAFGVVQMVVWYLYPAWWILPLFGLLVGYATNWIALRLIFQPLEPVHVMGVKFQGLFLQRQQEVSNTYSHIVTHEILTIRNMISEMLTGPNSDRVHGMIRMHFRRVVDETAGYSKAIVQSTLGPTGFANLKTSAAEKAVEIAGKTFDDPAFNSDRAEVIQNIMEERMKLLTPLQFQNMLRPAFQEDEWKLVVAGGVLGMMAGVAQLIFIFGA
ncbi:conserved hypothetical protein [gamma proteobacterium HTCC5015]|nr:conserved hypothetical protein [gamma proteobacterium HTCC5015]